MKRKEFGNFALLSMCLLFMGSCGASKFMDMTAPEESGLNVMKITDESSNSVMGNARMNFIMKNSFAYSTVGGCKNSNIYGEQDDYLTFHLMAQNWLTLATSTNKLILWCANQVLRVQLHNEHSETSMTSHGERMVIYISQITLMCRKCKLELPMLIREA